MQAVHDHHEGVHTERDLHPRGEEGEACDEEQVEDEGVGPRDRVLRSIGPAQGEGEGEGEGLGEGEGEGEGEREGEGWTLSPS